MAAAPGIVTSGTGPPNAVVQIQPGMQVQPVVLVDQNGQYLATSGSAATAGYLADLTGTVYVAGASAPASGQSLTATNAGTATWQFAPGGSLTTAGYLATTTASVYVGGAAAPSAGQSLTAVNAGTATWQSGANAVLTTLGDTLYENATPALARLAGPTTPAGLWLFTSTPSGGTAQAPAWAQSATLAGYLAPAVNALAFGTPITVNAALGNVFKVTLTASGGSISNPTNAVDGEIIRFRLTQDATGTRTIAWGPQYDWGSTAGAANSAPTLSVTASKTDVLAFEYNAAGTAWMYLGAGMPQGF